MTAWGSLFERLFEVVDCDIVLRDGAGCVLLALPDEIFFAGDFGVVDAGGFGFVVFVGQVEGVECGFCADMVLRVCGVGFHFDHGVSRGTLCSFYGRIPLLNLRVVEVRFSR
jgi:hypothetical protein